YRSGVGGVAAAPNEILVKRLDGTVLDRSPVRTWDLTQWKDSYDDWIRAFEAAVRKRAKQDCFIGLSSGYDSGAIACALVNSGTRFKAYVFTGDENLDVLAGRRRQIHCEEFQPDFSLLEWLHANIDNEPYTIVCDGAVLDKKVLDDGAALGIATIAKLARGE